MLLSFFKYIRETLLDHIVLLSSTNKTTLTISIYESVYKVYTVCTAKYIYNEYLLVTDTNRSDWITVLLKICIFITVFQEKSFKFLFVKGNKRSHRVAKYSVLHMSQNLSNKPTASKPNRVCLILLYKYGILKINSFSCFTKRSKSVTACKRWMRV